MDRTTTVNLAASQRPAGSVYLPHAPDNPGGVTAFPPALDQQWMEYLVEFPNRKLFSAQKLAMYLDFLQHPMRPPRAATEAETNRLKGIKRRALKDYELQGINHDYLYRKAEKLTGSGKQLEIRYAAGEEEAFRIIANTHCQFDHAGITKTWGHVQDNYYGICESNVKWVLKHCLVCAFDAPNTTKAIIQPIVSERCNDRIQIDLMDLRATMDNDCAWIIQIKDHFSHYVWLHPLKAKASIGVAEVMSNWFMYNGYPKILQCDNGTEFKGALLELCERVNVKVINGAPYKPSTQGSVESANKTFKRRLRARQTEVGTREWVRFLPDLAVAMNITRPRGLPNGTSPYEVWFGRKPHWRSAALAEYIPLDEMGEVETECNRIRRTGPSYFNERLILKDQEYEGRRKSPLEAPR